MIKKLLCANCQSETDHEFVIAKNELVATCGCGRSVKFPGHLSKDELKAAFDAHNAANAGQVPAVDEPIPDDHPLLKALAEL